MPATLQELDVNVVIDTKMEAAPLQSDISDIVGMDDLKHPQWDLFPSTLLTPVRGACSSSSLGRWLLQIELPLKYKVLLNSLYAFWLQSFVLSSLVLNRVTWLLSGLLHWRQVLQWMSLVRHSSGAFLRSTEQLYACLISAHAQPGGNTIPAVRWVSGSPPVRVFPVFPPPQGERWLH